MATRLTAGLILATVVVLSASCGGRSDPMDPSSEGDDVVGVEIRDFEFSRRELHISPGTTVRWRNTVGSYHTVTPDGHTAWTQWQTASAGETFEVRFDQVGTYPYYCMPHRSLGMTATIIVE